MDRAEFEINPGEIVGYRTKRGREKHNGKEARWNAEAVKRTNPAEWPAFQNGLEDFKMRIGYVPEEAVLYSHLSGYEYLQLSAAFAG